MKATETRALGRSGVRVSVLGLGGAPLGDLYEHIPEERALATIRHAHDLGVRLFDTAPLYGHGLSEHRFGHVLRRVEDRDGLVVSTKVGRHLAPERPERVDRGLFRGGLNFRAVPDYGYDGAMRAFEQSLQRLGMDRVDVVHIHDVDVWTWGGEEAFHRRFREAVDGAYRALHDLRAQGVIRAIGVGVNEVRPLTMFADAGDFDTFMLAGRYTLLAAPAGLALLALLGAAGPADGYAAVGDAIPDSLTGRPGDPARGRAVVADRRLGLCLLCHSGPFPEERFQGNLAPGLAGAGSRWSEGQLRLRLVDGRRLNPDTIMPSYHRTGDGLTRVAPAWAGKPVLTAGQIEDVVAFLTTLRED